MDQSFEVRSMVHEALVHRCSSLAERLENLGRLDCEQRVRWAFDVLARKFGQATDAGCYLPMQLTQTQIARIAGTSRQRANQAISRMKSEHVLSVVRNRYLIGCGLGQRTPCVRTWQSPSHAAQARVHAV